MNKSRSCLGLRFATCNCLSAFLLSITPILFCVLFCGLPIAAQEQNQKPIELSGFSISQAYEIEDDLPLDINELMLVRLAYRIKKTSPKSRHAFAKFSSSVPWNKIQDKTDDYRLWLFNRKGRLKDIQRIQLDDATSDSEIISLYVCKCETEDQQPFVIVANTIPSTLKDSQKKILDEPIGFSGFLYARSKSDDEDRSTPVFIASRLNWFPTWKNFESLSDSHLELAKQGFDVGLLDVIRKSNTKPLAGRDAEAFFQMLASSGKISQTEWPDRIDFQEMMQKAGSSFGKPVSLNGNVRTCSVIQIVDQDIRDRLGIDKYFQLIVFPDLGGKKIVIKQKDGVDDINDRFPITVCCNQLPDNLAPFEIERKKVRIDGFVYRFWKFQSERTDQSGFAGQVSPLIMTQQPKLLVDAGALKIDRILLGFVISVLAGIGIMVYSFRKSDQLEKTAGQKILDDLPDQIDVSGITE